ncbi:MAG: bifunctional 5,10-methylenetetrahydrofolate dehydrogenase/5,10-methenyltetrahydrofolate cyclohydrolase [bacterium]|nr:bifunctional 5,10-methylenetetrahydrofolate dehydrogenase/5,10-methenyltetrahydrofolate cyclohydrolase [bacterium]
MKTTIVDGKQLAEKIEEQVKEAVSQLPQPPALHVILVGDDPASQTYVAKKEVACQRCGIEFQKHQPPVTASEEEIISLIAQLNHDSKVTGILVQLPLPKNLDKNKILTAIDPAKDPDCLTPTNLGRLVTGDYLVAPATAAAVMEILQEHKVEVKGKHATVVGRSQIVGLPIFLMLQKIGATVTLCHSQTPNLTSDTLTSDILISGVGERSLIKPGMVQEGAVVIDCGFSREDKKIYGDVDPQVAAKASLFTPVPGGVGPLTVTCLLQNLLVLAVDSRPKLR